MEESAHSSSPIICKPKPVFRGNRFTFRIYKQSTYDFEEMLTYYLKTKKIDFLENVSFEEMENDFKNLKNKNDSLKTFLVC
jgi:hypothetical protein